MPPFTFVLAATATWCALRAAATRREGAMLAWLGVAAGLTPVALALAPLLFAIACRRGVAPRAWLLAAALLLAAVPFGRWALVPSAFACLLPAPLLALAAGLCATAWAWAASGWRDPRSVARMALALALVAATIDPAAGLAVALAVTMAWASAPRLPRAANDATALPPERWRPPSRLPGHPHRLHAVRR